MLNGARHIKETTFSSWKLKSLQNSLSIKIWGHSWRWELKGKAKATLRGSQKNRPLLRLHLWRHRLFKTYISYTSGLRKMSILICLCLDLASVYVTHSVLPWRLIKTLVTAGKHSQYRKCNPAHDQFRHRLKSKQKFLS